jgi:hypothetical protein
VREVLAFLSDDTKNTKPMNPKEVARLPETSALPLNYAILGIRIDTNDLALGAGAVYAALLYVQTSCFRREVINLKIAREQALKLNPANIQLLLMA